MKIKGSISRFFVRRPVASFVMVFLFMILLGVLLLRADWASFEKISFIDALFIATSAVCVTGLATLNIGSDFTIAGQIVILFLIQVGALGIMTGAAFILLILKKRLGIKAEAGLKTILEEVYISEVWPTIKFIIKATFIIEFFGAVAIFILWNGDFLDQTQLIFYSIFHSISAFCNAGFSLFPNSLENYSGNILINIVFSTLIIFGGIGFLVLRNVGQRLFFFRRRKIRLTLHSKLVLLFSVFLIFMGAFLFYFFESENLSSLPEGEKVVISFFQSATKTAGFTTVDVEKFSNSTIMLFMFLMFIGGAPGSVAGGIKVVSLAIILFFIFSFFKEKKEITIFNRSLSQTQIRNVFVLVSVYLMFCLVISFLMLYIEKESFEKVLFEVFSAVGTVGLSSGLTSNLSEAGKILITLSMFVGRILPLSIAIIGSKDLLESKIQFSEEKVYLG